MYGAGGKQTKKTIQEKKTHKLLSPSCFPAKGPVSRGGLVPTTPNKQEHGDSLYLRIESHHRHHQGLDVGFF